MGVHAARQIVDEYGPLSACFSLSKFNADDNTKQFQMLEADHVSNSLWEDINGHKHLADPSLECVRKDYRHWKNAREAEGCSNHEIPMEMRTLQHFTERSARAVSCALELPLTRFRPYDVEFVLNEYIEDAGEGYWLDAFLSEFHIDLRHLAFEARTDIVVKMVYGDQWRRDNTEW
jgi:hypothetical protein